MRQFEFWLRANPIKTVLVTIIFWGSGAVVWGVGGIGWFITGCLLYGGGVMLFVMFPRAWWGVRSR